MFQAPPLQSHDRPAIPGYVLGEPLGGGGFALVWAATRERDGMAVAVKWGRSDHPLLLERFARESDALKRVGPPYAPRWVDGGVIRGHPYIAMEWIRGETLSHRIAIQRDPPELGWIERTAAAVLAALETLHAEGLIHRDLKPDNVMITSPEERVVLLDYGLCKRVGPAPGKPRLPELTRTGVVVGTPEYMAPEQIRDHDGIDARADLYAFGVLLFELFTLRVPFAGETGALERGHLSLRPPRPSDFAKVPRPHEQIILSCLAKDPARRPASASAVRRALHEASRLEAAPTEAAGARHLSSAQAAVPKLLAEGRHLAVLMVAEVQGPAANVLAAVRAQKGYVVRQRAAHYTALFSGFDTDDPAGAALSAARAIAEQGGRSALHLANVTIRRKDRGAPAVYGTAVERPETWLPKEPWSGVVLSGDFERALPKDKLVTQSGTEPTCIDTAAEDELAPRSAGAVASARLDDGAAGRDERALRPKPRSGHESAERSGEVERPLLGRDATLAAVEASFRRAFEQQVPRLATLIGDAGLGKTRLAAEAVQLCRRAWPQAVTVAVTAPPPSAAVGFPDSAAVLRALVGVPSDPADATVFCVQALGEEIGAAAAPHAGALFGGDAAPAGDGTLPRMRAIAEALRRRARKGPVAVVLDDAHRADDALLDALEYATLDGEHLPLWVLVAAAPSFEQGRRAWGNRTRFHDRMVLGPLSPEAATELAARLLLPAEYPPSAVLERLAKWAGGNPFCLHEIVRALKRAGLVRQRPHGGSFYVATADVENLPPLPAWQWLAVRQLDAMPAELAACVRLASVLGVTFTRTEIERIQDALDRAGEAGTPLDMSFAMNALVERGILQRGEGERYAFQNGVLRDAVYEMLDPAQRQKAHRHAFELWLAHVCAAEQPDIDALERMGRHAAALGERAAAASAYVKLGDTARTMHKDTEADRYYTLALQQAPEADLRCRALTLLGRGRSRYRVAREKEALEDFQAARALTDAIGDQRMKAEILLEEATALDWSREFEASVKRVEEARRTIEALSAKDLDVRLQVAVGRMLLRQGRSSESIARLTQAVAQAAISGEYEARVIALLLLSAQLAVAGQLEQADAQFQEVISLVSEANDLPHLGIAYSNRVILWMGRREPDRATDDLHRAIKLAREIGNPWLERFASNNVATLLHWNDQRTEALALSRRACLLEQRFVERPVACCSLLLACILIGLEQFEEAARTFTWISLSCAPDGSAPDEPLYVYQMLQLVLLELAPGAIAADHCSSWDEIVAAARLDPQTEVFVEVLYWRVRCALHRRDMEGAEAAFAEARSRRRDCPIWPAHFERLECQLAELQAAASSG